MITFPLDRVERVAHLVDQRTLERVTADLEVATDALEVANRLVVEAANRALAVADGAAKLARYRPITRAEARQQGLTNDCVRVVAGWDMHLRTGLRWPAQENDDAA